MIDDPSSGVDMPAAVIVECVQGEGGLNVAREEWLKRLQALCNAKNIIFIVDDIQAGCGRCGSFFSFEPAGIKPDIITLSKSLSGYGLPFAVTLIARELDQWKPGEHNGTFRGNNHAFVTSVAMLEQYWRTPDFAEGMKAKITQLTTRLNTMVERFSTQLVRVRGRGMFQGLEFADPAAAAATSARAFEHGLIIERCGPSDEVVKCMMALTISTAELDEGLSILERAIEECIS
jgi:diaminobutyrate-2-oxoglutarate transaminase